MSTKPNVPVKAPLDEVTHVEFNAIVDHFAVKVDNDGNKVLSDVNFSTADKSKLDGLGAFGGLSDAATVNLPVVNGPLAAILATKQATVELAFNTALPLNAANSIMEKVVDVDIVFTQGVVSGAGTGGTVKLQSDGIHTITMPVGWIEQSGSEGFDASVVGLRHRLIYYYDGDDVTYSIEQLATGAILTTPDAPTDFVVDDTADTGNWTNNPLYTALSDYEKTVDGGTSYQAVTSKPMVVGDVALAIGMVGVRVKAVPGVSNPSLTLYNTVAYTVSGLPTPDAPTDFEVDDDADTGDWTNNPLYTALSDLEQTLDGGTTITAVSAKPIVVGNVAKAAGQVGVRVKGVTGVRNPSAWLFNSTAYNLITPAAPTAFVVDDTANTGDWTNNPLYTSLSDLEQTLDGGTTVTTVPAKPIAVGNVSKAAGQVGVRVKAVAGVSNASAWLFNATPYLITPAAPTNPIVDDTADTLDWTNTPGFTLPTNYEYRTPAGSGAFTGITAKPLVVGDVAIAAGDLEIRVKAVAGVNTASATLPTNDPFTVATGGAFPVSEDFEGAPLGGIPTGWAATASLQVSANGVINGAQELKLPSAGGAKFMAYSGGVSGIATKGTVLLRKLTSGAAGSGGIFLRANSAVPASITDTYVAWMEFGPAPKLRIYEIFGTNYAQLIETPNNFAISDTDVYSFSYDVSAAHVHTVRVQRSSDSRYLDNIGAWVVSPADALTHSEVTPRFTTAGNVGFWAGDLPGTADMYADDVSFT